MNSDLNDRPANELTERSQGADSYECPYCHEFQVLVDNGDGDFWCIDCGKSLNNLICGECGSYLPYDERVKVGMKCGNCAYAEFVRRSQQNAEALYKALGKGSK